MQNGRRMARAGAPALKLAGMNLAIEVLWNKLPELYWKKKDMETGQYS